MYLVQDCGCSVKRGPFLGNIMIHLVLFSLLNNSNTVFSLTYLLFHPEVDVCLESDVCDQLCVHLNGILTCDCNEDYQMNLTTRECNAKGKTQTIKGPFDTQLITKV